MLSTPILNLPISLPGMRIQIIAIEGKIEIRPVMYLALS